MQRLLVVIVMSFGMSANLSTAQEGESLIGEEVMTANVVTLRENGDLEIQFNGNEGVFRLDSIRLPDSESNVREEADELLQMRLIGKSVEVHTRRSGGRDDVRVGYTLQDGEDVRVELVARGLARYCHGILRERQLERSDREARRTEQGIWSADHNMPVPHCEDPT